MKLRRQLVHRRLHSEDPLGGPVAPVGAGGHDVGVHHVIDKPVGLQVPVQGNGFCPGQSHGGGTVLPVGAGIGKGMDVNGPDPSVGSRPDAHLYLHFMAGGGGGHTLLPGKDQPGRLFGHPGHKGRKYLRHHRLFGAEAAADAGFGHPDPGLGDPQGVGEDPPHMKDDLGGAYHVQSPVGIDAAVGAEGLHHGLLGRQGVIGSLHGHRTVCQHLLHIPFFRTAAGAEISFVVGSHRAEGLPVLLRVDQQFIILGLPEIQQGRQHLVGHFYEFQGFFRRRFCLRGHNGHRISHIADVPVQDQPVIGAGFRVGLSGHGKPLPGHILPGVDRLHPGHPLGFFRMDLLHQGVGVGAPQKLHHQRACRDLILQEHRLARHQSHGVFFPQRLIDNSHCRPPFFPERPCFCSRKFRSPRSCPS